jgi:hypothetical protein
VHQLHCASPILSSREGLIRQCASRRKRIANRHQRPNATCCKPIAIFWISQQLIHIPFDATSSHNMPRLASCLQSCVDEELEARSARPFGCRFRKRPQSVVVHVLNSCNVVDWSCRCGLAKSSRESGIGGLIDIYWQVNSLVNHEPRMIFEDGVAVGIIGSRCCMFGYCTRWRWSSGRVTGRDQG